MPPGRAGRHVEAAPWLSSTPGSPALAARSSSLRRAVRKGFFFSISVPLTTANTHESNRSTERGHGKHELVYGVLNGQVSDLQEREWAWIDE